MICNFACEKHVAGHLRIFCVVVSDKDNNLVGRERPRISILPDQAKYKWALLSHPLGLFVEYVLCSMYVHVYI